MHRERSQPDSKVQATDMWMQQRMLYEALKAFDMKGEEENPIYNDPAGRFVVSDVKRSISD